LIYYQLKGKKFDEAGLEMKQGRSGDLILLFFPE
jgi:hypothetical protein